MKKGEVGAAFAHPKFCRLVLLAASRVRSIFGQLHQPKTSRFPLRYRAAIEYDDRWELFVAEREIETIAEILDAYRAGKATPADIVARSYARFRALDDPAIFISLREEKDALAEAEALIAKDASTLPLYGVPVAVKDNIDVAGLPTTAACPAYS